VGAPQFVTRRFCSSQKHGDSQARDWDENTEKKDE
jgi:hypothetical protein